MLIDTDVLIWYMRGNRKAFKAVEALGEFSISVVTYIELVQGLRNKAELNTLKNFLQAESTAILPVFRWSLLMRSSPPRLWIAACHCSPAMPGITGRSKTWS
jgi:predicted nucleic acid-binding protein